MKGSNFLIWEYPIHRMVRWIVGLFTLVILVISVSRVSAQVSVSGVEMYVDAAFHGHFKYGEWLPLWIDLSNNGTDVEAEIRVQIPGSTGTSVYSTLVELPSISHKRVPLYVLPNNFSRELAVQIFVNNEILLTSPVEINPHPNSDFLIGIATHKRGALSLLSGMEFPGNIKRSITLIDIDLDEFPDRFEGLRSYDLIVLNDLDTSELTLAQLSAVEDWVSQGGRLVIGGGAGALKTVSGIPKTMLPMFINETVEVNSVSNLSNYTSRNIFRIPSQTEDVSSIRVPGPFVIAIGELNTNQVLVWQEDLPLMVEKKVGSGIVQFVALDPSASPFDAWNGTAAFWEKLVGSAAIYPEWIPADVSPRQQTARQIPFALSNLPMLDLPSIKWLALFLGIYILLIGPSNYLVLKRIKRLHWAWITIPVITLVFSLGAFSLGYALRGTDIFVNKIVLISPQSDGSAIADSYLGVFSPGRRVYDIEIEGDGLISPIAPDYNPWDSFQPPGINLPDGEIRFVQGNPGFIKGFSTEQWSMQSFVVEGIKYPFGYLSSDLVIEDGYLVGTVSNHTSQKMEDVVLVANKKVFVIDEFLPEEEIQINLNLEESSGPDFGPPLSYRLLEEQFQPLSAEQAREIEVRRSILDSLFSRMPSPISSAQPATGLGSNLHQTPFLLGWISNAPPDIKVVNRTPGQQTTGLVVLPLDYRIPEQSHFSLPVGMIPGALVKYPIEGGMCGEPGSTAIFLAQGDAVFEFRLPDMDRNVNIENLKVGVWSDAWFSPPGVEIFSWKQGSWISLQGINQGINLVPDANEFVSPSGIIRLSLLASKNNQSCYYVDLGLEGYQN